MKKKFLSILLTIVMAFTALAFTACNGDDDEGEYEDPTKSHLYVVSYDGGWGIDWLHQMARDFEAIFRDVSFEDGREGVVVHVKGGKGDVTEDSAKSLMASSKYDVYFTTFNLREFYLDGQLMDVSDLVNKTNDLAEVTGDDAFNKVWNEKGETRTIAEKMDGAIKDYYLYAAANAAGQTNNKYYGIPMYSSFYNINYDIDLFYEKGLYLKEDGTWCSATKGQGSKTREEIDAQKSLGQDGIKGTEDDGLPITFEDFKDLCERMKLRNVNPICWSGNLQSYRKGYFNNFWANYEGADDWYINVTSEGTDSEFGEITVEDRNGWKTAAQKGRLAALQFAEAIIKNEWWDTDASNGTDHYGSQDKFLQSKYYADRSPSVKRIGMFIEGGWWENEAKNTLETMANQNGGEYVDRDFGVMTYPRMDDGHHTVTRWLDDEGNYTVTEDNGRASREVNDMTLVSVTPHSNVAIRANALQERLAKLFFVYSTTDENLRMYTRMTGSTRCYDYELTDDDLNQMSTFKQQLWGYYSRAIKSGNIRYISGPGKFSEQNKDIVSGSFGICYNGLNVKGKTCAADDPLTVFQLYGSEDAGKITAEDYFNAYKNYFYAEDGKNWKNSFKII